MSNWKPLQFIKYSSPHARARVHAVIVTVAVNVRGREHVHACAAYALP